MKMSWMDKNSNSVKEQGDPTNKFDKIYLRKSKMKRDKKRNIDRDKQKSSSLQLPKNHKNTMRRNIAQSRLTRLRSQLDAEIKLKEKLQTIGIERLVNDSAVKLETDFPFQKLKQVKSPKTNILVRSTTKNTAERRLEKLQKELRTIAESTEKDAPMEMEVDVNDSEEKPFSKETSLFPENLIHQTSISTDDERFDHDSITFVNNEISKIRNERSYMALHTNLVSDVAMDLHIPVGDLFIVVDTNIFLSHLKFIDYLLKHSIPPFSSHVLVIPWPVIQEIDYAMKKNDDKLASQARYANNLINDCLKKKNPHFFGQSLDDFKETFKNAVNVDDFLLQYCMKFASIDNNVVLLTNDINLTSKAMINQLKVYSKAEFQKEFNISGCF